MFAMEQYPPHYAYSLEQWHYLQNQYQQQSNNNQEQQQQQQQQLQQQGYVKKKNCNCGGKKINRGKAY
ncbi:cytochrome C oxidase subunit III [Bacillus sp. C1]